jgi:ABC-2 type transport system permease protein
MSKPGTHQGLSAAGAPPREHGPDGAAAGYRSAHTLPLTVEVRRQLLRRRTQLTLAFLVLLPFLLVAAFKLGSGRPGDGAPGLVDLATTGAANFTLFTVFAAAGFLLVVVVALFAGDTVASEASWSSLRYLLAAPVPRGRLLRQKLVVALGFSASALLLLPAVAYLAGGAFFGWAPARTPLGTTLSTGAGLVRLLVVVGYLAVTLLFVAALAFLLGVWTDAPLGAVGGAVLLVIVSNILDAVTALGRWREVLPTHYSYAWTDALGPTIAWDSMARGALWSVGYSVALLAAAWWHFLRKDVTS